MEAVLAYHRRFIGSQIARLEKYRLGNRHLADVVQKGSPCDYGNLVHSQFHGPCDGDGERGDAPGVLLGLRIFHA